MTFIKERNYIIVTICIVAAFLFILIMMRLAPKFRQLLRFVRYAKKFGDIIFNMVLPVPYWM